MKRFQIFLFLLTTTLSTNAQVTFQKTYGSPAMDYVFSIEATNDGGYILCGFSTDFSSTALLLTKTDGDGNQQWSRSYGGTSDDVAHSVKQTSDGGFIMTGWGKSFGFGNDDVYLVKTNSAGHIAWVRTFGGTQLDEARCVQQTSDGGYVIAGRSLSFGNTSQMYVIKTDVLGDTIRTKAYGIFGLRGWWIEQTSDGGYVVAGLSNMGPGTINASLIKLDADLDTVWTRVYGSPGGECGAFCVKELPFGGYILAGSTTAFGAGQHDAYVIRTDANGDLLWSKTYGGPDRDDFQSVVLKANGDFAFAGNTESFPASGSIRNAYLVGTDANGDTLYTKTFGGASVEFANAMDSGHNGGLALGGWSTSFSGNNQNKLLIKVDDNGKSNCYESSTNTIATAQNSVQSSIWMDVYNTSTLFSVPIMNETIFSLNDTSLCFLNTGLNDFNTEQNEISIYPNPVSDEFSISLTDNATTIENLNIINSLGQTVYSATDLNINSNTIKIGEHPNGIYFLQIKLKEHWISKKFLIQN